MPHNKGLRTCLKFFPNLKLKIESFPKKHPNTTQPSVFASAMCMLSYSDRDILSLFSVIKPLCFSRAKKLHTAIHNLIALGLSRVVWAAFAASWPDRMLGASVVIPVLQESHVMSYRTVT